MAPCVVDSFEFININYAIGQRLALLLRFLYPVLRTLANRLCSANRLRGRG
jgi:hypothetical protein